jgi:hypothetical protein
MKLEMMNIEILFLKMMKIIVEKIIVFIGQFQQENIKSELKKLNVKQNFQIL